MNILLIPSGYLPLVGGVQRNTHALARSLVARGHRVTVLTSNWRQWSLPIHETLDGIEVFRVPFYVFRGGLKSLLAFCCVFPVTVFATWLHIRRTRADIVNVHFAGANAFYALLALFGSDVPLIVTFHGGEVINVGDPALVGYTPTERSLMERVIRAALARAHAVTAVSQYLLDRVALINPEVVRGSQPIFMGSIQEQAMVASDDPALRSLVPNKFVLAVGRLVREKGFDLLVEAFRRIATEDTELELVIVGDGRERTRLEAQVASAGLLPRVTFTGMLKPEDINVFYRQCLMLAVPSRWQEAFPGVILEAFLHNKPVVAAAMGGVPEMVTHEVTGLLVAPEDPQQLAAAIRRLMASPELCLVYGRNGGVFARTNVDRDSISQKYESIYQRVSLDKHERMSMVPKG
jgi:glycogen(starch) synthase